MRLLIQRVNHAQVAVDGNICGKIGKGLLVFIGVGHEDTRQIADKYLKKLLGLRIFEDENGKTNLSLADVKGELLMISQFTLYADCKRGNRPGFTNAGAPDMANELYQYMIQEARKQIPVVEEGIFGADMKVSLENVKFLIELCCLKRRDILHEKEKVSACCDLSFYRSCMFRGVHTIFCSYSSGGGKNNRFC